MHSMSRRQTPLAQGEARQARCILPTAIEDRSTLAHALVAFGKSDIDALFMEERHSDGAKLIVS